MELGRIRKRKACNHNRHLETVTIVDGEGNEATQSSYGFVSFFGETVRRMKANDERACITREVRKELGMEFKKVAVEETKFLTRCAPDRFAAAVGQLTDDQREVVSEMGLDNLIKLNCGRLKRKLCCWLVQRTDVARCVIEFSGRELQLSANSFAYIMGVSDGGMRLQLEGDRSDVASYLDKYNATSSGINVKTLADILQNSREANDEFKVTFMLFTLCTILCPPIGDTKFISKRNWASFCYDKLIQGITRYKEDHLAYVGGCVLYLEMLFCNSIVYGGLRRDRSISPIALWNGCEIKRLIKWIEKKGGYGSIKVTVPLNAGTMKTSVGGSCIHSEQDCTNKSSIRQPIDAVNDSLPNLIRQYRAGPFVVARSLEHIDIKLIKYIMNKDLEE
ncbi:hypothetical protein CISIN_1g041885mg, partial [Citrus sinensis]